VSEANLERVRALVRAFETRDRTVADHFTPDVVMHAPEGWPEPGPMLGREEVIGQFVRLGEDWKSYTMTITRTETRPESVIASILWKARGAASEIALDAELTGVYFFRDGLVHELAFFWSWDEAVAAADRGPSR
jgi:ketosteroid isomerase-like protein